MATEWVKKSITSEDLAKTLALLFESLRGDEVIKIRTDKSGKISRIIITTESTTIFDLTE